MSGSRLHTSQWDAEKGRSHSSGESLTMGRIRYAHFPSPILNGPMEAGGKRAIGSATGSRVPAKRRGEFLQNSSAES